MTGMTVTATVSVFSAPIGSIAVKVPSVVPDHSLVAEM